MVASLGITVLLAFTPQGVAGASSTATEQTEIYLSRESQPSLSLPTIAQLKRRANELGTTLPVEIDKFVDQYIKDTPGSNPNPDNETNVQPNVRIDGLPLAELTDLQLIAKTKGITFEEALAEIAWQPKANEFVDQLKATYPEEFSGATIGVDGDSLTVGFKHDVPTDAVVHAKTLPASVTLIGNKGFSEAELQQQKEHFHEIIARRADVAAVSSSYDIETGALSFKVKPKSWTDDARMQESFRSTITPGPPSNTRISVKIDLVRELKSKREDTYLRGGGLLDYGNCTNGFNITNGSSYRTTTAAHCYRDALGASAIYSSPDTGSVTIAYASQSTYYDIASYGHGTFTETRTFYYNATSKRYAHDYGTSPIVGQTICHYGATSGASCSDIEDVGYTYTGDDGYTYHSLVLMEDYISAGGDSGGPWYYGNRAWGIHHGYIDDGIFDDQSSAFTPAYLIPSALGASWYVWTCSTC